MDSYDLFWKIKNIWMENVNNGSGAGPKHKTHIATMVMTENGYREILGVKWNKEINAIELIIDEEYNDKEK